MSLRHLPLSLLRQGSDAVPDDSDANVMKIVVDKEGCIPMILRQSMAEVATSLGIEQFPTALGRVTDGVCLSRDEMIEGGIEGGQRPFVRGTGAQHVLLVHGPAEGLQEFGLVVLVVRDPGHSIA